MNSIRHTYKIGRGPSSSHTMGPARAATEFRKRYEDKIDRIEVTLFGSLALTGKGHLTDKAIELSLKGIKTKIIWDVKTTKLPHPNTMLFVGYLKDKEVARLQILSLGGGSIKIVGENTSENEAPNVYPHQHCDEILKYCKTKKISLFQYVKKFEPATTWPFLEECWKTMNHAIDVGLTKTENLPGKINFPRNAKKVYGDAVKQKDIELKLAAYAYAGGESNASGEIICICPTAGSFATLPAVLRYSKEKYKLTDKKIIEMLAVAGIIGEIVKTNGSVAGAEAGCCAEVGTGCSMAAAAFAYMLGLSNEQIANAASFAMTHHIGLTCDPVLGLVQFPCIERNVAAANRAITAGRLAKNIGQNLFSFDEVVETMTVAGRALQSGYRETSTAGFAKTYLEKNKKNKGFGLSPKEGAGT